MTDGGRLDLLPIWGVYLTTVVVVLLAFEGGLRVGPYRRRRSEQEDRPPVSEMVAAPLASLAFLLGFTFGLGPPGSTSEGAWSSMRPTRSARLPCVGGCFPSPIGRRSEP